MSESQRLAYRKSIVSDDAPEPWTDEYRHLFAYFQRFRPDGDGLERVFAGMDRAGEVVARMRPFYDWTREDAQDAYFVVRNPIVTTSAELLGIIATHFDKVREIALLSEVPKLISLLDSVRIEVRKGEPPPT